MDNENVITYSASDKNVVVTSSAGDSTLSLLQSITICLALPLVLFSLDIHKIMLAYPKIGVCKITKYCVSSKYKFDYFSVTKSGDKTFKPY